MKKGKGLIFHKHADYDAFVRALNEGLEKYPVCLYRFPWD